jgi:CTP:molybdopterin cytidylyltransferase MocA
MDSSSISYGIHYVQKQQQQSDGILICLADQPLLTSVLYRNARTI